MQWCAAQVEEPSGRFEALEVCLSFSARLSSLFLEKPFYDLDGEATPEAAWLSERAAVLLAVQRATSQQQQP